MHVRPHSPFATRASCTRPDQNAALLWVHLHGRKLRWPRGSRLSETGTRLGLAGRLHLVGSDPQWAGMPPQPGRLYRSRLVFHLSQGASTAVGWYSTSAGALLTAVGWYSTSAGALLPQSAGMAPQQSASTAVGWYATSAGALLPQSAGCHLSRGASTAVGWYGTSAGASTAVGWYGTSAGALLPQSAGMPPQQSASTAVG